MKRLLSLIFSLVILMSTGIVALGQGSDYEDNWAKSEINYMKNKGILSGYPDGTFRPTNNMSKSEFYKVVNGIMGFTQKSEVNFNDVSPTDWYYDEVQKGVSANYILSGTSLNANENITRGEVARIIGIIFGVEEDKLEASKFTDNLTIPEELKGVVGGLKKNGYINGYPDGTFRANAEITRAEVVKMLYNISGEIVNASGTINKNRNTNLIVNTKDVMLKDIIIGGNLYLTEGIGEGNTILDNVVVKGKVIVNGGSNGLSINNSKLNSVSIDKKQGLVNVVLSNTTVEELKTVKQVRLELTKGSYIKKVEVRDKASLISAKDTSIDSLSIVGADVIVDSKGTIKSIKSGAQIKANGSTLKTNVEYRVVNGKLQESNRTVASTKKSTTTKPPTRSDPVTLNRISVKSLPDKLVYTVDDELDITGLVIEGIYSDGSRETERVTKSNITGFDSRQPAERQALTIKIGGRTTAYTINIQANDPVKPEVNKRKLAEAIAEAIRKSEEDYTEESWKPFEVALDMAIEVNEDNEATQRAINQVLSELNARIKGLIKRGEENLDPEPEEVDKSELIVVIDRAEEKNEEDYTPETWRPFIESLEAAIIVRDSSEATQEEVDDALYELNDKMDELVEEEPSNPELEEVDKSELIDAIDRAERINKEDYTIETWEDLEIALETAIEVIDDLEATQNEVDRALEDLNAAIEGLEIKESPVEPSITNILPDQDISLKTGDTLEVSFNAPEGGEGWFRVLLPYENSVDRNINRMADEEPNKYKMEMEEIEPGFYSATWVVGEGIKAENLEVMVTFVSKQGVEKWDIAEGRVNITMEDSDPVVDKTALAAAIAEAMAKKEEDYTEESWRSFAEALQEAIEINDNDEATQEEVNMVLIRLNTCMSALVEKEGPVDPVEEPRVKVEVRNPSILMPFMIQLKVEAENILNAAKYDVVYQLSGGQEANTAIFDLGTWSKKSFFFNPRTITDKVTIRIYDVEENLLYTFEDVVLVNPMIPK